MRVLPGAAMLLVGCTSTPTARLSANYPAEQAQIRRRLDEIFDAAEKKDLPRLDSYHFYGPKFTKFAPEASGRLDAVAARKGEHDGLAPVTNLSMRADDLKVDVFGDLAIATFVMDYSFKVGADTAKKRALATLVFVKNKGAWQITHEHFSPVRSGP